MASFWRAPWAKLREAGRGRAPARGDLDALVRSALLCVLERDLDGAERALRQVVAADSDQLEAYLSLARIYRQRGEVGRAIRLHQNLLLRNDLEAPLRRMAQRGLAADFRQGGFLQRAAETYQDLLTGSPHDVAALEALVELQREVRQPEAALETARRLHRARGTPRRDPAARAQLAAILVEVAEAARQDGRADAAERAARKAVRLHPGCAEGWTLVGELETERGRSRKALQAWQHVASLDARSAAAIYPRLQSAFAAVGRARDFETLLRETLGARPDDSAARLALARALRERGAPDEATKELAALLEHDPDHLEALAELARLHRAAGREAEAGDALARLAAAVERRGLFGPREWGTL